ncbi:MAG: DbpA RNA binding domain-containing protein [Gemmatimonadota bacterium]
MSSFEQLGLGPEVVDALTAEGYETPSSFQEDAIPVVGRGNNLVGRAGPGAGVLLSYGAPLLDRLEHEGDVPKAVVLVPTRERATELGRRLSRIATATGHRVAALAGPWALVERAHVLFATPVDLLAAVESSALKLSSVEAFVVDGAAQIRGLEGLEVVETVTGLLPTEAQKVILSLPVDDDVEAFAKRHVRRPVHVPSKGRLKSDDETEAPHRGTLRHRIVDGDRLEATLATVADLLEGRMGLPDGPVDHVLLHFHTDDQAADVGDALTIHGYVAGAPGNGRAPVWLGADALEARKVLDSLDAPEKVATLSHRVPLDVDSLDQRHGRGGPALTLARGRELAHLEECARIGGYELVSLPDFAPAALAEDVDGFRARLERALERADLAPYLLLLEPLLEKAGAARVAAAAAALLRSSSGPTGVAHVESEAAGPVRKPAPGTGAGGVAPQAWVRLFFSLGSRDGAGPGDILGAITGEARVDGSKVGRIDIHDTFSIVELDQAVARSVIDAMNGITVKGRSLRVDFDRPRSGGRRETRGSGRSR